MSELNPPRKPRRSNLTPEQLREVNLRRSRAGNGAKSQEVDRRLAARLLSHGWTLYDPTGKKWTTPEQDTEGKKRDWHKY